MSEPGSEQASAAAAADAGGGPAPPSSEAAAPVTSTAPAAPAAAPSRTPLSPPAFARLVLVLGGVVWGAIGLWALSDPDGMAATVDLRLRSDLARLEIRAMYGGFSLALGLLHLVASSRAAWLMPALVATGTCTVGLVSGRLFSVALDGISSPTALILIGSELALIGVVGLAIWRLGVASRAARRAAKQVGAGA